MIETSLLTSADAIATVIGETRSYGEQALETGGFLFANTGSEFLTGVAMAGDAGITRRPRLFQISERALDRLFTFADDRGFWIPVQFHSHEFATYMSKTDSEHGLRVEGFVSTIIPQFAAPPGEVSSWGWWQFHQGGWHPCAPPRVGAAELDLVIVFDEDGVREH